MPKLMAYVLICIGVYPFAAGLIERTLYLILNHALQVQMRWHLTVVPPATIVAVCALLALAVIGLARLGEYILHLVLTASGPA